MFVMYSKIVRGEGGREQKIQRATCGQLLELHGRYVGFHQTLLRCVLEMSIVTSWKSIF